MRARLGLFVSGIRFEWREILLRDKPLEFLEISSDGTVPVMQIGDKVIQESLDIFLWAIEGSDMMSSFDADIIAQNDGSFKTALDQYKYASRHGEGVGDAARATGAEFIAELNERLSTAPYLNGHTIGATDLAILPFIRQYAHVDMEWFYGQDWPKTINWLDEFKSSDLFKLIMTKLPPWQNGENARIYGQILRNL